MSDEQTPGAAVDVAAGETDPTAPAPEADAPGGAKGRRSPSRRTPAPPSDEAAATPSAESTDDDDLVGDAAAETAAGDHAIAIAVGVLEATDTGATLEASSTDADSHEEAAVTEPELFDPQEVANAPRAPHPLKPVVEALIFASPEPLTIKAMQRVLEDQSREDIEAALAEVRESYQRSDGLQLVEVAGGYQIVTRPELYEWVRRLFKERTTSKLSVQALETLAVIAYKQPVTSGEIAEIRGVSATTGVLNTLLDRKLVKIVGRKQVVGRPFMYGTTREFLDKFGLRDLSDLPKVEDMSEALGFDLPSPVDESDGVSLPFDDGPADAGPVAREAPVPVEAEGSSPSAMADTGEAASGMPDAESGAAGDLPDDADPSDDSRDER